MDGETLREWVEPAYVYPDGSGFSYPWELMQLGNYTLRTKDGVINGYNAEFQMAVSDRPMLCDENLFITMSFLTDCITSKHYEKGHRKLTVSITQFAHPHV